MKSELRQAADRSLKTTKLAFSAALFFYWGIFEFYLKQPAEVGAETTDTAVVTVLLVVVVMDIAAGLYMASKARAGAATHLISAAMFEAVTLFAFVYSLIAVEPQDLAFPVAIGVSLAGIWLVSPNTYDTVDEDNLPKPRVDTLDT